MPADRWLALRMAGWSLLLPLLKRVLPLKRLTRLMWTEGRPPRSPEREHEIARLSAALVRLRPKGSRGNCLERSLLAYRFLSRAGAEPRLVLGVGRSGAAIVGHAWITVDEEPIQESMQALSEFTPFIVFGVAGLPVDASAEVGDVQFPRVWR